MDRTVLTIKLYDAQNMTADDIALYLEKASRKVSTIPGDYGEIRNDAGMQVGIWGCKNL